MAGGQQARMGAGEVGHFEGCPHEAQMVGNGVGFANRFGHRPRHLDGVRAASIL
jgi:hypothetical protein